MLCESSFASSQPSAGIQPSKAFLGHNQTETPSLTWYRIWYDGVMWVFGDHPLTSAPLRHHPLPCPLPGAFKRRAWQAKMIRNRYHDMHSKRASVSASLQLTPIPLPHSHARSADIPLKCNTKASLTPHIWTRVWSFCANRAEACDGSRLNVRDLLPSLPPLSGRPSSVPGGL